MSARPRVEVVVDEIVLRGVAPERAEAVVAALEARLGALAAGFAETRTRLADRDEASRRLPSVDVASSSPRALGDAIAGAVWATIDRGGTR